MKKILNFLSILNGRRIWPLAFLFVVAGLFLYGRGEEKRWEAILPDLPTKVSTEDAIINGVFYVLKQTHEPLFRIDNGRDYSSKILKTWNRNLKYTDFTFCPDTSLSFSSYEKFSLEYFKEYITRVTMNFDPKAAVSSNGNCFAVKFPVPRKSYLDYLTQYTQAPTVKTADSFELGLGRFVVRSMTPQEIRLSSKKHIYHGYNTIIIHRYAGPGDPQLLNRNISDFNKISSVEIPEWVKSDYVAFEDVVLNTVTMVINHPDKKVRETIYNCMDVEGLRRAFISQKKSFLDIGSVIPIGVFGAKPGLPSQVCKAVAKTDKPILFANLRVGNEKQMSMFMEEFTRRTGLVTKVFNCPASEFLNMTKRSPKGYNLVVMSKDSIQLDVAPFVRYFHLIDYKLPSMLMKYEKMTHADDPEEKKLLGEEISSDLAKEFVVLPLYQNLRGYLYPRGIKNLTIGHGLFEFPEVADLRW